MIEVIKPGLYTTLQDGGRFGCRSIGVPVSGFMDACSANYANYLLKNLVDECLLEFVGIPPTLKFIQATQIVVTGVSVLVYVNNAVYNNNTVIDVAKGDVVSFSEIKKGWRGYIAVKNGINSRVTLGSQSQYKGITELVKINKNDIVNIKVAQKPQVMLSTINYENDFFDSKFIEFFKGPDFKKISPLIIEQLINNSFTISASSSRMATIFNEQIDGQISEIITAPVQPGTMQLTPSGKLIILMRDAQTSGGYSRVFQCTEKSINILSQKRPNEKISFKIID